MSGIFNQPPHTLFSQQVETIKHNRLFLDDMMQEGADMHDILNQLHNAGENDTLEIRINSGGGIVRDGQQLINVMRDRLTDRCVTILDAEACSMAALVFMAGNERVIYPHSILMIHDLSMGLGGKVSESASRIDTYLPVFLAYFKDLFGDSLSKKEIKSMFDGKDYWFNAKDMCKRGMADFVVVNGINLTAKEYLESLQKPKKGE